MGRPLHKDVKGTRVTGSFGTDTPGDNRAGIRVEFHDGTDLRTDGIIIKQRGAKTFVVARNGTPLTRFTCVLQSATPAAFGQMRISGAVDGTTPGDIPLNRLTRRVAQDFSGNRYTWELVNFEDSSGDAIKLTPVTA
jgi:hypothetical protein